MAWPPTTHQDVEDDLTNGHGWAGSLIQRFGVGEQLLPTSLVWTAGDLYSAAANALATTTNAPTANRLILSPIYFPTTRTVDQIGVNVSTAGTATHVARLGIYNASPTSGLPTTVKVDAGTVAVDSTGSKTLTISTTLSGLYWLAITTQSGTFTAINVGACAAVAGAASTSSATSTCLNKTSTVPTSALPDLTGDATVGANSITVPRVMVRAA